MERNVATWPRCVLVYECLIVCTRHTHTHTHKTYTHTHVGSRGVLSRVHVHRVMALDFNHEGNLLVTYGGYAYPSLPRHLRRVCLSLPTSSPAAGYGYASLPTSSPAVGVPPICHQGDNLLVTYAGSALYLRRHLLSSSVYIASASPAVCLFIFFVCVCVCVCVNVCIMSSSEDGRTTICVYEWRSGRVRLQVQQQSVCV